MVAPVSYQTTLLPRSSTSCAYQRPLWKCVLKRTCKNLTSFLSCGSNWLCLTFFWELKQSKSLVWRTIQCGTQTSSSLAQSFMKSLESCRHNWLKKYPSITSSETGNTSTSWTLKSAWAKRPSIRVSQWLSTSSLLTKRFWLTKLQTSWSKERFRKCSWIKLIIWTTGIRKREKLRITWIWYTEEFASIMQKWSKKCEPLIF